MKITPCHRRNRPVRLGLLALLSAAILWSGLTLDVRAGQKAAPTAAMLYQQALHEEDALGNLKEAIKLYERVLALKPDPSLAANALIRMAGCHDALKTGKSRQLYERVLKEYPDQRAAVEQARTQRGIAPTREAVEKLWTGIDSRIETMSPDGRYLVGVVRSSPRALLVHDVVSGKSQRFPAGDDISHLSVTPDGKRVVYNGRTPGTRTYELRIVNLDGTGARTLVSSDEYWSYEVSGFTADGKLASIGLLRQDRTWQLGLLTLETGKLQILKNLEWRDTYAGNFSPDGRWLVYSAQTAKDRQEFAVYAIATDGSVPENWLASRGTKNDRIHFSPDGSRVVFINYRNNHVDLASVRVSDGKPMGVPEVVKANIGRPWGGMGFGTDGSYYFHEGVITSAIYVAQIDQATWKARGAPVQISDVLRRQYAETPKWSPDGHSLAYVNRETLVIRDFRSGQERELLTRENLSGLLNWSADGKSLVLRTGVLDIQTLREEAPPPAIDLREMNVASPDAARTPDGKSVILRRYLQGSGGPGKRAEPGMALLIRRDLASGVETEMYRTGAVPSPLPLLPSPDGRSVAYGLQLEKGSKPSFWVLPLMKGEPRELAAVDASSEDAITWTPDSRAILFVRSKEIWVHPVDGSAPYATGIRFDGSNGPRSMEVSPDGARIAFDGITTTTNVWAIRNLFPARPAAKK